MPFPVLVLLPSNHFLSFLSLSTFFFFWNFSVTLGSFSLLFPGDRGGSRRVKGRNFSASTKLSLFSFRDQHSLFPPPSA